ncbi:flagellar basal body L-ring protein FlgH [Rhodovulum adriaticum]|uniref:Flagellar L-ring protein n=1 Tax=Rhodovulum adriaticum TaxID=35804 RepID=A0A4V2SMK5_RHOAD|nr:flagellar basal body L-ring protein FlgH [Rhodovulum adriaticum]MBK1634769.1 flagellar basal body L-ring protein [Rhodovulum adriaticum]TCP27656.1 flagellar L-ring protein precursor FlgH [Rhodovulum adriaticum]
MPHALPAAILLAVTLAPAACTRLGEVGRAPDFNPVEGSNAYYAMLSPDALPQRTDRRRGDAASLWAAGRQSLLGDRRAGRRGDILTVVIEIDDKAEMSNASERSRDNGQSMGVPHFFGVPQRAARGLPEGAGTDPAVQTNSQTRHGGEGSVSRNETLELRIAATITDVLANGVLRIEGSQEVRVNFEMRELLVTGYVRPEDISRQNEITYDKIAAARISYGGRGQITDVQQPRWGQQITDLVLPF